MGSGDDFDRALTTRGKEDAGRLGKYLARIRHVPELAIVSAAKRTSQTFDTMARRMGAPVPVKHDEGLYNATATDICGFAKGVDAHIERLMIVGHNPGIMEAALTLAGDGDLEEIAGVAILTFAGEEWRDVATRNGRLEAFALPEDFAS